jgi:hypothetical protein
MNICLILSTIYIVIPVSGCIGKDLVHCFARGSIMLLRRPYIWGIILVLVDQSFWIYKTMILCSELWLVLIRKIVPLHVSELQASRYKNACLCFLYIKSLLSIWFWFFFHELLGKITFRKMHTYIVGKYIIQLYKL